MGAHTADLSSNTHLGKFSQAPEVINYFSLQSFTDGQHFNCNPLDKILCLGLWKNKNGKQIYKNARDRRRKQNAWLKNKVALFNAMDL